MRVLWINHRDPQHPNAGGAEVHIAEVGKRLVKRGHHITLMVEKFPGSSPKEVFEGINVERFGGKYTQHIYAPYFVKRRSRDFDIVIDDIAHAVPFWSPLFTTKPVTAIIHHVHQDVVRRELHPILSYMVETAEGSVKYAYDNIIAVSQTTKRDLIDRLDVKYARIKVIHYGIDHNIYRPGLKFKKPTIIWIGRMKRYKNPQDIIEAFCIVKEVIKDAELVFAGKGDEETKIRALIREKVLDGVTFTGWVSGENKVRLLQGGWCVAYTSDVEGWGMGILEAAACGIPAVAYDRGALREAIIDGKTGHLVKYADVYTLAEKLTGILNDANLLQTLSKNALQYSCNFDWDKATIETEEYLESLT